MPACARCSRSAAPATAISRPSPATTPSRSTRATARRLCSPSSVASSRRTAAWPKTPSPGSRPSCIRRARLYGTRASTLLGAARTLADLGTHFGADLYQREVDFLTETEWARTAEDILWRRTKLGLRLPSAAVERLATYLGT